MLLAGRLFRSGRPSTNFLEERGGAGARRGNDGYYKYLRLPNLSNT